MCRPLPIGKRLECSTNRLTFYLRYQVTKTRHVISVGVRTNNVAFLKTFPNFQFLIDFDREKLK